ncbi:hypothetical protein ACGFZB_26550 [Streptomyces cinerochromogenes]|uniref:Transposase n=1 Tax=Streptomyces cinerochromogenes TaxID=66422 RepID=A0ABW7BDY6_9ACTN
MKADKGRFFEVIRDYRPVHHAVWWGRAFAHLHWFRRLRIRWQLRDGIHEAFLALGCARLRPHLPARLASLP